MKKIIIFLALICASKTAYSAIGNSHVSGTITKMTSVKTGILIQVNGGELPTACNPSPVWILIPDTSPSIISTFLSVYMSGKRDATVYINANSTGYYCEVVQYQPNNL